MPTIIRDFLKTIVPIVAPSKGMADMKIKRDTKDQVYIEWEQVPASGGCKRAWIHHKTNPEKDWAGTGRYLSVVRIEALGEGPSGNATDFPISSKLSDEQIVVAFVTSVSAITGCPLSD